MLITPSASEPFGLVMLEAILKRVPVAAAEGVGIAEFIPSLPQMKPWDQYNYVRLAERLLTDQVFRDKTIEDCYGEATKLTWSSAANIVEFAYRY